MSGSMLDAITIQRRGIPATVVGVKKLALTTGRGMARAQGVPDFPMVIIDYPLGSLEAFSGPEVIENWAQEAAAQVEGVLLGVS